MAPVASRHAGSLLLGLIGLLAAAAARGGADFGHYLDWARAFSEGDVHQLASSTTSPMGLPLSQWAHGSGLLFALGDLLVPAAPIEWGAGLAGWIAAAVFWWCMRGLLAYAAAGRRSLVLFGLAATFVGTHAGFFSVHVASESLATACCAALAYLVMVPRRWFWLPALATGAAAGLLITIRPHLGTFALLGLAILTYQLSCEALPRRRRLLVLGLAAAPALVSLVQVALVNFWMTGSPASNPYGFGSGDFRSLDLARPALPAVLIHPWHGLLVYHPLYGVAALALGLLAGSRSTPRPARLLWLALIVVIGALVYIQAAWYTWWLGLATFGLRGLGVALVPLAPALVHVLERRRVRGLSTTPWIVVVLVCCAWSYLLLLQGETNFVTPGALVDAQLQTLMVGLTSARFWVPACAAIVLLWRARLRGAETWATYGLACLVVSYVVTQALHRRQLGDPLSILVIVIAEALLVVALAGSDEMIRVVTEFTSRRVRLLEASLVATVALSTLVFLRLAVSIQPSPVADGLAFDLDEVEQSYEEYQFVDGFDADKHRLRAFLDQVLGELAAQQAQRVGREAVLEGAAASG